MRPRIVTLFLFTGGMFWIGGPVSYAQPKKGLSPEEAQAQAVAKGGAFLKSTQAADGSWGTGPTATGMTGIVVTSLLKSGLTPDDPAVAKALKFIETLIDEKDGHIAGPNSKVGGHNYPTCINLIALATADPEWKKYGKAIEKAAAYLIKLQWDESEGKKPEEVIYGGAGYGGGTRPDLSNTHFFLDALMAAKVPTTDPAFKKALIFVSRCQNFKSEFQDQPWAGKINDGSFIYTAAGDTRGATPDDGTRPGYGSMTYAGMKCLIQSGISKEDARVKKSLDWLKTHYSVDVNPGMPEGSGPRGLYYYLWTMANSLTVLGEEEFMSADGVKHIWRNDITSSLVNRQKKDGSWSNDISNWMETNPDLCTAYALNTLSLCKVKAK
ncbi:MAG: terpene cyclase/mutase family protein [Planctomycetes bacterium]|nr:terpene cyclase/mutase family protein [Planctomycetota bacterium]